MEQVVCVNDGLPKCGYWPGDPVVKGVVYTVSETRVNPFTQQIGYSLDGLSQPPLSNGEPRGYLVSRFRPVRKTSIEIFRAIDREIFSKKKIDA